MSSPFAQPASAAGIDWNEVHGSLVIIEPSALETGINTTFGDKDAVRASIAILDGPMAETEYDDILIFPLVMIGQLRPRIGQKVLGRVTQGTAKAGQKPAWMLAEATEEDTKLGMAWLNRAGLAQPASAQTQPKPQAQQQRPKPGWSQRASNNDSEVPF